MADSLEVQLAAAERALATADEKVIRTALESQITAIKKKMTSKDKRTATLKDGTAVRVGDTVYSLGRYYFRRKGTGRGYSSGSDKHVLPTIAEHKVAGINTNNEIALERDNEKNYSWNSKRMSYQSVAGYFGSPASAAASALSKSRAEVTSTERELEAATTNLAFAQVDVCAVEAWATANGADATK